MPMDRDFENACALIEEHCIEYLVVARYGNGLIWKESSSAFGIGAATRYLSAMDEKERHQVRLEMNEADIDGTEDDQ